MESNSSVAASQTCAWFVDEIVSTASTVRRISAQSPVMIGALCRDLASVLPHLSRNMASSASRNVHSRKLVMLGQTAVGKTCISVRFVRDRFVDKPDPTIGGESVLAPGELRESQM